MREGNRKGIEQKLKMREMRRKGWKRSMKKGKINLRN